MHRHVQISLDRARRASARLPSVEKVIEHAAGGPVWMQVAALLRAELERIPAGGMLPSVRYLTQEYGVAEGTVKRALRALREEGLIVTYQGSGSFKA